MTRYWIDTEEHTNGGYEWFPVYYGEGKADKERMLVAKFVDEDDAKDFIRMASNRDESPEEYVEETEVEEVWPAELEGDEQ